MNNNIIYPIQPADYDFLLNQFSMGSSIAENDPLLETAQIKTQEFWDLWYDRIDLVRGIKGAGKTALFRLFYFIRKMLFEKQKVFIIQGVEPSGDPVFKYYKNEFEKFDEIEFQNFWRIYFVFLIHDNFLTNPEFEDRLKNHKTLLDDFAEECDKVGIPTIQKQKSFKDRVDAVVNFLNSIRSIEPKVSVTTDPTNPQVTYTSSIKVSIEKKEEEKTPIFVNNIRDILISLLEKLDIKIWILLDRLDEVFLRRTQTEINGLKSLLKSAYSFSNSRIRIKVFLREDIIESMIHNKDGFTGLTHVTDRSSQAINWQKNQILYLIVKRIFSDNSLAAFFKIDIAKIDNDQSYREESFYKIFPEQIQKGKNQPKTFEWIYNRCLDGNNNITPRDVIDLLEYVKQKQLKLFKSNPTPQNIFFSPTSITQALEELSKKKKETYLQAEFPHFWPDIKLFEHGKAEHNDKSLEKLLGSEWKKKIEDFDNIGFIKYFPSSGSYKIPIIWRAGLNIKQRKAFSIDSKQKNSY